MSAVASSSSRTLQAKIVGLSDSKKYGPDSARSSGVSLTVSAGFPLLIAASILPSTALPPPPPCRRAWRPCDFFAPLLHHLEVGEHQLGIDDVDVANEIDRSRDVMDVRVLETTDHLHDGIDFADVGQELVPQSFPCSRL